jgi:hypothetical protein
MIRLLALALPHLLALTTLLLLIITPVHAQQRYAGQSIEQILALPDEKIDLGIACLILANGAHPENETKS